MRTTWTYTLCAVLVSAACADVAGPELPNQDGQLNASVMEHEVIHADGNATLGLTTDEVPDSLAGSGSSAPELEQYKTSFIAVQGEQTVFRLHYKNAQKGQAPFLTVLIPSDAQMLDPSGTPIPAGDSVEISVEVDQARFLVLFDAGGISLTENTPVTIEINVADPSLGSDFDGGVSAFEGGLGAGKNIPSSSVGGRRVEFKTTLFSNYAVAW